MTKSVKSHYLSAKKFAFNQNVKKKLVQFFISNSVFLCPLEREIRNINHDYQQKGSTSASIVFLGELRHYKTSYGS